MNPSRAMVLAACCAAAGCVTSSRYSAEAGGDGAGGDAGTVVPGEDAGDRDAGEDDGSSCTGPGCHDDEPTVRPVPPPEPCADGTMPQARLAMSPIQVVDRLPAGSNIYTALHWAGTEYGLVWSQFGGEGIFLTRIDGDGDPEEAPVRIRGFQGAFDTVWADGSYGSAWSDDNLHFQRVNTDGALLGEPCTFPEAGEVPYDGGVSYGPRLAWVHGGFSVVWGEQLGEATALFVARIDETRCRLLDLAQLTDGGSPRTSPTFSGFLEMAAAESSVGLVWQDMQMMPFSQSVTFASVGISGEVLTDPVTVAELDALVFGTGVGWDGAAFVVGYSPHEREGASGNEAVVLQRMAASDGPRGEPVEIVSCACNPGVAGGIDHNMSIVSMGGLTAVVWKNCCAAAHELTVFLVDQAGNHVGSPLSIPTGAMPVKTDLVWTGAELGLTWADALPTGEFDVYFTRVAHCP